MLTHSLTLGNRESDSCCWGAWEGFECATLITHKCPRAGGHSVINVPPHSRHLTRGCIPGVMGSSWAEVSGSTAENKPGRPWGTPTIICPLRAKPAPSLPAGPSQPGNHFRPPIYRGLFDFNQCGDFVCKFINNFSLLWFENADLSIAQLKRITGQKCITNDW